MITTDPDLNFRTEQHQLRSAVETSFYDEYSWCLNPFLTIPEAARLIGRELARLEGVECDWQRSEIQLNVSLLACLISDTTDDYLLGPKYSFSQASNVFGPSRLLTKPLSRVLGAAARVRDARLSNLSAWRAQWEDAIIPFAAPSSLSGAALATASGRMESLLKHPFPRDLKSIPARIPAAFRSQDLTHFDVYALGRKFIDAHPDTNRPVLVVGLRTAGSYFAPLLRAFLKASGFRDVSAVTLRPKAGTGARERQCLKSAFRRGSLVTVIDEPVYSASTVARGIECLKAAGFSSSDIVALFPVHPQRRDWHSGAARAALSGIDIVALAPEEWHKAALLATNSMKERVSQYFGTSELRVRSVAETDDALMSVQEPGFHCRLKRVYEVDVEGEPRRRKLLAKSTGWGWLGYHAFIAGRRLKELVPEVLGLRDGILVMEWVDSNDKIEDRRNQIVAAASSYAARRSVELGLKFDPVPAMASRRLHRGTEELAAVLSGAYNSKVAAVLKRPRLQDTLSRLVCSNPGFVDGKMRPEEWVSCGERMIKTDFEHHGMGKHQLNVTDPAYDLADTILYWRLSAEEEQELIRSYIEQSGDSDVVHRLFINKLLAGTWAIARAIDGLRDPKQLHRHAVFNERYLAAWNFLTINTTRFCGSLVEKRPKIQWSSPLAVLDVDGVLDKQIFGFPSSTAAGIKAISLLASHGFAVALNTARSVPELKAYCRAYGFVGGVAEYGAYAWDGISDRGQVLISEETLRQMDDLRQELRRLPGVFVNDTCQYSVRAYTYSRATTIPLPEMQVRAVMERLGVHRLHLHQTFSDSTVTAAETDKGRGLEALLSLAGCTGYETAAVGDTEPDLAMFRVATRSFAPGHISCPDAARQLRCDISRRSWQPGLLEAVQRIVHRDAVVCSNCVQAKKQLGPWDDLFVRLLHTADQNPAKLLLSAMLDRYALRAFLR